MLRNCFCVVVLSAPLVAGTREPGTPDSRFVEEGRRWRHCVGEISGEYQPRERYKGSCVAFDPHWVLTAAHVIDGCRDLLVEMPDGSTHAVTLSAKCPEWTKDGIGFGDIAVCRVKERFDSRCLPQLRTTEPVAGPVVVAGYGFTGTLSGGQLTHDGKLRAGTNRIERVADGYILCVAQAGGSPLEYHIESGDSGGPLFDEDGRIVGIHSSTLKDVGKGGDRYGDESVHTRVDRFHDWIKGVMDAATE